MCARWMFFVTIALVVAACPLVVWQLLVHHAQRHVAAFYTAALAVLIAVPLSVYDISQHLLHYVRPSLQRYVIRILWMVPVYSLESWLSLRFREQALIIETAREAYEAYVIWNFAALLISIVAQGHDSPERAVLRHTLAHRARHPNPQLCCKACRRPPAADPRSPTPGPSASSDQDAELGAGGAGEAGGPRKPRRRVAPVYIEHMVPCCCLRPWRAGRHFLLNIENGCIQYVLVKVFTAITTVVLEYQGVYGEGELLRWDRGYVYVTLLVNFSQCWAMYCLVLFYHEMAEPLKHVRPIAKLTVVKSIVFFSWWQAVFLAAAVEFGWIRPTLDWTSDQVAKGLQDYLICLEMVLAALAHHSVFSYSEFRPPSGALAPPVAALRGQILFMRNHHNLTSFPSEDSSSGAGDDGLGSDAVRALVAPVVSELQQAGLGPAGWGQTGIELAPPASAAAGASPRPGLLGRAPAGRGDDTPPRLAAADNPLVGDTLDAADFPGNFFLSPSVAPVASTQRLPIPGLPGRRGASGGGSGGSSSGGSGSTRGFSANGRLRPPPRGKGRRPRILAEELRRRRTPQRAPVGTGLKDLLIPSDVIAKVPQLLFDRASQQEDLELLAQEQADEAKPPEAVGGVDTIEEEEEGDAAAGGASDA